MKRFFIIILLLLAFTSQVGAYEVSHEAVSVVVSHLKMNLMSGPRYAAWDALYSEWWTIYDLYPYTGFF